MKKLFAAFLCCLLLLSLFGCQKKSPYTGQIQTIMLDADTDVYPEGFEKETVMTLEEYADYCAAWQVKQLYTEPGRYAVYAVVLSADLSLTGTVLDEECGTLVANMKYTSEAFPVNGTEGHVLVIPIDDAVTGFAVNVDYGSGYSTDDDLCYKPIIYLYPTEAAELTVTLGHPEQLSCAYPAYEDGWTVLAQPDGTLTNCATGRSLYALYWEGKDATFARTNEGFVVKGCDTAAFLEEKLAVLGLNAREAEEFIIYWLPKLQNNAYNYIRFAAADEIDRYMPLRFSVQPDSVIRVMMVWQALDAPVEVTQQQLTTPERSGFVAVEWGGTELH